MNQEPVSRTRDLHGAIGGATMRLHHKKRCSHVFIDSQTHVPSQGTEFVMNFAFEIRRESNPRGSKPLKSHKVFDLNHSADRVYTIGTEGSHHM